MTGFIGGGSTTVDSGAPRVASLQIQTSIQGRPVPIVFGKARIAANLIDFDDFVAHKHKESSGGKGGGVTSVSYTYSCSVLFGLCEGTVAGISTVWEGKNVKTLADLGLTFFSGSLSQTPFGYWSTNHSAKALGYRATSYVAASNYDLGSSASLPNLTFEITGLIPYSANSDAIPAIVAVVLLANTQFGAGLPIEMIGDWSQWGTYSVAAGIFISPAYIEQRPAQEMVKNIATISNTALFFSEGKLKAVPYGDTAITANGVTYTPNVTPIYDLTYDDFLVGEGESPIKVTRSSNADAYNQVQVQYYDRTNQYNDAVATQQDLANINLYGLRPMPPVEMHEICDPVVAFNVAQLVLQRALYIRNTYEFKVNLRFSLLEQMDIVTLTDPNLGLDKSPVRITRIEEDDQYNLTVTAEDYLGGISHSTLYPNQSAGGYAADYNTDPGNANAPVIFEPPENLAVSALELWIMASGGPLWGGCQVWISSDGVSYVDSGTIQIEARQGVLASSLGAGTDPDLSNVLAVDMTMSGAQVLSGSQVDVDSFNTLCYVDGELIAYRDSNLASANHYNLTYLRRGIYNTPIASHAAGTSFVRLDFDAAVKYPFDFSRVGQTIYVKLVSFNIWGGGLQDISAVSAYSYTISGAAMNSPPDNVANLHTNHRDNLLFLYWDEVTDFRPVDYEIRTGPSWNQATRLGRISDGRRGFQLPGNGSYWICARALGSGGNSIYSVTPQSIAISGAAITKNVIASFNEQSTSWSGTLGGGAVVAGSTLQLAYTGDISTVSDITTLTDVGAYGDVSPSGTYTAPTSHRVTLAAVADCLVQISFDATAYIAGSGTVADPGPDVDIIPQVRLSTDAHLGGTPTWSAWQDYKPGTYRFSGLDWRVSLVSRNTLVTPQVNNLTLLVDVPDLVQPGHVATSSSAVVHVTYGTAFNGGSDLAGGGSGLPVLQITILNAQAGDLVRLTNKSLTGFDVDVVNGGTRVVRSLDFFAQGY